MPRYRSTAVALLLAVSPIAAQQIRPYRPAFDAIDYALTIELPDSGASIRGTATVHVQRTAPSDSLVLDLLDLSVSRAAVNGKAARFWPVNGGVAVALPKGNAGQFDVTVDYDGTVVDGLIARRDSAGRWTYFGDNWPNRARHWIPSIDHPSDKATVTWRVIAPPAQTVVANGKLLSTRDVRGRDGSAKKEWIWREGRRIPVYLMVIAAAPLVAYDLGDTDCGLAELQRCVPQTVYTAPEQKSFSPGPFARAGEMVQLFSRLVAPFPYEKLAHLQSSTRFGGMENASAIFYADRGFRAGTMGEGVVAHETAHQWFGDAVTEREWPHVWLSEGFATYFSALWTRAARGDSAFREEMSNIRQRVLDDQASVPKRPVVDTIETDLLSLLNRNSYEKGGFVLHMLKNEVGERAFFDALRVYYAAHKHATAVTDDLRAAMEHEAKRPLGWFFDQWLKRPGYPEVSATWTYDAATKEVAITATQSSTFGAFQFPLTVAVVDSSGVARRATLSMTPNGSPAQTRIPLATSPARVTLDPDVALLARLRAVPE
jgi:aminopeptidase N